jgi:hypothetical protein
MPRSKKTYDVFLSYSPDLRDEAKVIIEKFAEEGLAVFNMFEIEQHSYNLGEEVWQALAESWAVVALIRPGGVPPFVAVELGAASAWQKPVYILTEGEVKYNVPLYFSKYHVFSASEIRKVVELILKGLNPLSDEERAALIKAYSTLRISTDKLLMEPASIERLKNMLWKESRVKISGERMMQELLRLRKRGKLPRVLKR